MSPDGRASAPRTTLRIGLRSRSCPVRPRKMHANEVDIDVTLVRRLLAAQFPTWADLPIEPADSAGTVHAIYRLGDDMAVRLPRIPGVTEPMEKEHIWLPILAPLLPLTIPT